ncbi:MAG: hypothetical protein IPJ19_14010 [Planctomycetes bacterium]|nr:hypothetical protein [Planctomycetota bacterium]
MVLRVCAWILLCTGGGAAIWIWFASPFAGGPSGLDDPRSWSIVAGIAAIFQGVLGCAFLLVVAGIAEAVNDMRRCGSRPASERQRL